MTSYTMYFFILSFIWIKNNLQKYISCTSIQWLNIRFIISLSSALTDTDNGLILMRYQFSLFPVPPTERFSVWCMKENKIARNFVPH